MAQYIEFLCDSHHGQYIPQIMAMRLRDAGWAGMDSEDVATCNSGPEQEWYWDAWHNIECNAEYIDEEGNLWRLWQDGDLYAIRDDIPQELQADFMGGF